jgi:ArsR family transcriptional regulator
MSDFVKIFKALADINRLKIMKMLAVRPLCVCEITVVLDLAPSTVSKHCSILRDAGLISDWKDGKWVNYKLNDEPGNIYTKDLLALFEKWFEDESLVKIDMKKVAEANRNVLCN